LNDGRALRGATGVRRAGVRDERSRKNERIMFFLLS
jgi:hypothetical protein